MYLLSKLYQSWYGKVEPVSDEKKIVEFKDFQDLDVPKIVLNHHKPDPRYDVYLVWIDSHNRQFEYCRIDYEKPYYTIFENYSFHTVVPVWSYTPQFMRPLVLYYNVLPKGRALCPYLYPETKCEGTHEKKE